MIATKQVVKHYLILYIYFPFTQITESAKKYLKHQETYEKAHIIQLFLKNVKLTNT